MLEQVVCGVAQSFRIVSELPESGIARATDHSAKRFTLMVVIDVKALFLAGLSRCSTADCAHLTGAKRTDDLVHLMLKAQHAHSSPKKLRRMLLRIGALPCAFFRQCGRFLRRRTHDLFHVVASEVRFAFSTVRSWLRCRACTDAERGDWQAFITFRADARLPDFKAALLAKLRDEALQAAASARAPVVVPRSSLYVGHFAFDVGYTLESGLGPVCAARA